MANVFVKQNPLYDGGGTSKSQAIATPVVQSTGVNNVAPTGTNKSNIVNPAHTSQVTSQPQQNVQQHTQQTATAQPNTAVNANYNPGTVDKMAIQQAGMNDYSQRASEDIAKNTGLEQSKNPYKGPVYGADKPNSAVHTYESDNANNPNNVDVVSIANERKQTELSDAANYANQQAEDSVVSQQRNEDYVQSQEIAKQNMLAEQQKQKDPKTWQELRDQIYGSEEDRRKKAQRRAMINGIGESLRHIGNLYFTGKGATPQQFNGNAAVDTLGSYEAGKKERDAMSYQMWQQKQKDEIAQQNYQLKLRDQVRKDAESVSKKAKDDATTQKLLMDMDINKAKFPYEIQESAGRAAYYIAHGKYEEAHAEIEQLSAEYLPLKQQLEQEIGKATIEQKKASASASRAQAAYAKVRASVAKEVGRATVHKLNAQAKAAGKSKSGDVLMELSDGSTVEIDKNKSKIVTDAVAYDFAEWAEENGLIGDDGKFTSGNEKTNFAKYRKTGRYDSVIMDRSKNGNPNKL